LAELLLGLAAGGSLVFLFEREQKLAGSYRGAARYMKARKLSCDGRGNPQVLSLRIALQCAVGLITAAGDCCNQNDCMEALHQAASAGVGARKPSKTSAR